MNIKKIILLILVLIWMGIIYNFSSNDTNNSNNKSINVISSVSEKTIDITNSAHITNLDSKSKAKELSQNLNLPLRKVAHGSVYFILCILLILLFKEYKINRCYVLSVIVCFLYACSDEFHQLFVYGRTSSIIDILIDTLGSIIALGIYIILSKYLKKGDVIIEKI